MVCLTTNQYVGDVLFGFIVRVFGTFFGAAVGLMIWSIAAQTGKGNPFAVAATCAVFYPFIFFYRVHQTPIMTAILPAVTAQLVIGTFLAFFSLQPAHLLSTPQATHGRMRMHLHSRPSATAGTLLGGASSSVPFASPRYDNY